MLTPLERRVVGNLITPRNKQELTNRVLEIHYSLGPSWDPTDTLKELEKRGLVVNLGEGQKGPGDLVARADGHPKTINLPDERAHLYETRMVVPHRRWRAAGEQWFMTQEGYDELGNPESIGDPTPMPTFQVEQLIQQQYARTHPEGVDVANISLSDGWMLQDEFLSWATAVADAHEEATGERPNLPIAGGAGYSDASEISIIDHENGKANWTAVTPPWYMAATATAVDDTMTGATLAAEGGSSMYTGYARKTVAALDMAAAAAGSSNNANAITFANCTAGTAAIIGFAKCLTGPGVGTAGVMQKYGACTLVNVSSTQQPLSFAAGAFTTSVD